jgi:hypothetical protein
MANDYASQFEQARKNYREQLDTYRSSHKEEDLVKANEAYQAWLNTSRIFVRDVSGVMRRVVLRRHGREHLR